MPRRSRCRRSNDITVNGNGVTSAPGLGTVSTDNFGTFASGFHADGQVTVSPSCVVNGLDVTGCAATRADYYAPSGNFSVDATTCTSPAIVFHFTCT